MNMGKKKNLIELSLTDFVDYVSKAGSSKLTKVRQLKERDIVYNPAHDFYKALREGITDIHRTNGTKADLNRIIENLKDKKKLENYNLTLEGYKKFWGRKNINYFDPPFKHWIIGDLDVRINPELGLEFNGEFYIIKLYFKSDKLSKDKTAQILTLMEAELRNVDGVEEEVKMAILDVKNSKLYIKDDKNLSLIILLAGEAKGFQEMWNSL